MEKADLTISQDVPEHVFRKFVESMQGLGIDPEVVGRLRKTLLEDRTLTEKALKLAIFPEEPLL